MNGILDSVTLDISKIRENIAEEFPAFKDYHKYLLQERQKFETKRIKFVDIQELLAEKHKTAKSEDSAYEYDRHNDSIVAEVRRYREELLEKHGGIENYLKYLKEQRPVMEAQGWKFASPKESEQRRQTGNSIQAKETI